LDRLLFVEPKPDPEGPTISQAQLTAFIRVIARLAQFVLHVFQVDRLVVALNREDLTEDPFEPGGGTLLRGRVELQKAVIGTSLHVRQRGHLDGVPDTAEIANLGWIHHSLSCDRHWPGSSQKTKQLQRLRIGAGSEAQRPLTARTFALEKGLRS